MILTTTFIPDDSLTGEPDGQATVTVAGGTPPYYYQWNDPYHQTNSTAISLSNGHYKVMVSDYAGCSETADVFIYYLSVRDQDDVMSFGLYPNPAHTSVHVAATFNHPVSGLLQLQDMTGSVLNEILLKEVTTGKFTFSVATLPSGLYFVVLRTDDRTVTRKFMVSK